MHHILLLYDVLLYRYSTGPLSRGAEQNIRDIFSFFSLPLQRLEQIGGAILALSLQRRPRSPLVIVPPARVCTVELDLHIVLEAPAVGALALGIHARAQWVQPREQHGLGSLALGLGSSGATFQTQLATLLERQVLHVARDAREHGQARGAGNQVLGVAGGAITLVKQVVAPFADLRKKKKERKVNWS